MILLADEGVDKPIVDQLRSSGFDVHYILETDPGSVDEDVLRIANEESRILLTQDKDFGEFGIPPKASSPRRNIDQTRHDTCT